MNPNETKYPTELTTQKPADMPVAIVPLSHIREQIRNAEIDIAEATMRRDMLRLVLDIRERAELNRTREIIEKIYDETIL
jgi:hypothetical protein